MNHSFTPGQVWSDHNGKPIQAHGGGILYHGGVYYWYGEDKSGPTLTGEEVGCRHRVDVIGVHCYSSTDLYNWKDEGLVLESVKDDPAHDLHTSKVVERPKVVYNKKTGKFVLWAHIDQSDYGYARTGVAVSDSPVGPFEYQGSFRPNGGDSRDMTVFVDDDGKAYLFHSSEWNKTMYIGLLSDDYLSMEGTYTKNFVHHYREAPAVCKRNGKYYMFSSGCTGWDPNEAEYAVADNILGPWESKKNPCVGKDADKTFYAQSTFVFPVAGKEDAYIFMADIWKKESLGDSRYVWLPIEFKGEEPVIEWRDEWELSVFDR